MPLIKNKLTAKLSKNRSKYLSTNKRDVIREPKVVSPIVTTRQKLSKSASKIRESNKELVKQESVIIGKKLSTINSVDNIFTLNKGQTLKDVIVSHYNSSSSSSVISIYWSVSPYVDLTFTVSSGVITAVTGGNITRLVTDTFVSKSTLSLNELAYAFESVNKNIYFYAVCSVLGPEFTIIKK